MKENQIVPLNNAIIAGDELLEQLSKILRSITEHHKKVSQKKTPKVFIKQKMGYDYVEDAYMRKEANAHYPGWSFTIIGSEIVGNIAVPKSMALKVHGRLRFFDNGIWREGDMITAHRIQFKKDKETNEPTDEVVDMGNDFKAAVTDCMKKAFNAYMNIADDVYRKQDPDLTIKEIETIRKYAREAEMEKEIEDKIQDGEINKLNYEAAIRKLKHIKMTRKQNEKP